ncbi:M48 family metallopeptidase [Geotalea toluenoxydans]|uniref:M48 family metallopeptidase n=1 Tax=Geotalea toluenoxydans TaxID=421624 RepID=UPI0006D26978|nr:SprT family zinc-dependent metalloprotease [Geotalea toluenoxydans]
MTTQIRLGEIAIDVVKKDIKNIHLSVYPPAGRVCISVPQRMDLDTIRVFAISKLGWIKKQQQKLQEQEREFPREYLDRESHYVWGKRYLLKIVEKGAVPYVTLKHNKMVLRIRPDMSAEQKQIVLAEWYREKLKEAVPPLINKWEPLIGVKVHKFFVQRMKTKWGSCNSQARNIRLNTELAKKPPACLEYVLVHEMVHLLEPTHNSRFITLMDQFMASWRNHREELNRSPLGHEEWAE